MDYLRWFLYLDNFVAIFVGDYYRLRDMATYTITVDERTREGKSLVRYLRDLGVIVEPNDATLAAVKEIRDEDEDVLDISVFEKK